MGAKAKHRVDTPSLRLQDWRKLVIRWVVILGGTAIIYWVGESLNAWAGIFPAVPILRMGVSLLISWIVCLFMLVVYRAVLPRLLIRSYVAGMKYFRAGNYEAALESFKQHYDVFDRHPWRDWVYTILMLDVSKYSHREIVLLNQAYVYFQLGDSSEVTRCYEECLALNPDNELVTSSLNLAAAVSGGEIRPMPGHILYRAYISGIRFYKFLRGYQSVVLLLFLTVICFPPFLLAYQPDDRAVGAAILDIIIWLIIAQLVIGLVRWIIARLLLMNFFRGERLLRKGQYWEGIHAFQNQITFLQENPWIEGRRQLLFPNSGLYSYQEWALLRIAYGYTQLGEGDQLLPIYEQILALNYWNGMARTNIDFIKLFREED